MSLISKYIPNLKSGLSLSNLYKYNKLANFNYNNNNININYARYITSNTHIIEEVLKNKIIKNKNGLNKMETNNNTDSDSATAATAATTTSAAESLEKPKRISKKLLKLQSANQDNQNANSQFEKSSLVLIDKNRRSGLKHSKPTTPSMRFTVFTDRSMLFNGPPIKKLTKRICRSGGRNHHGKITVRHRGGGGVRKYRMVDFKRIILDTPGKVLRLEYDPFRRAHLALVSYPHDTVIPNERKLNLAKTSEGLLQYIIAPQNLSPGDTISSSRTQLVPIHPGNAMTLSNIPIGVWIYNIELIPGYGAKVCRSAGTTAQILEKIPASNHALVRFRSKEQRLISLDCLACIGAVSNPDAASANLGKAGRSRWLGRRPQTRGTAMNPVDHPHGGGHGKDHGGRYTSLTPWGKPTKGYRTRSKHKSNKLIAKRRFDK